LQSQVKSLKTELKLKSDTEAELQQSIEYLTTQLEKLEQKMSKRKKKEKDIDSEMAELEEFES
jgi:septal ring factor EnvC (AmiA/AmiB activator)